MPLYDFEGNVTDQATYDEMVYRGINKYANAGIDQNLYNKNLQERAIANKKGAAYALTDATAAREAGDYTAEANRATADRTNNLAMRLAGARRTPGGGIRLGLRKKGITANAISGLTKANANERLNRRKKELRAAADQEIAADFERKNQTGLVGIGPSIWAFN